MSRNPENNSPMNPPEGILLVDKPRGKTSFHLVSLLRRITGVRKIGHAGTLDPFATGLMILLIGKPFTRKADLFLGHDKEYRGKIHLGISTNSYDIDGKETDRCDFIPSLQNVEEALKAFQGLIAQTPPMFSAKKVGGKKLYELARKGITLERAAVQVSVHTELISYEYPFVEVYVRCSKGTYIRSIAHDLGTLLGTGAHLSELVRTKSGPFHLKDAVDCNQLSSINFPYKQYLRES